LLTGSLLAESLLAESLYPVSLFPESSVSAKAIVDPIKKTIDKVRIKVRIADINFCNNFLFMKT